MMNKYTFPAVMALLLAAISFNSINAQVQLRAHVNGSYWQHTELYGLGLGFGMEVPVGQFGIALDYSYGYGTTNRYDDLPNLDQGEWITVFANEEPWNELIGPHSSTNLRAKTDYAKQHQLTLMLTRTIHTKGDRAIHFGLGGYAAVAEHFFTFTNVPVEVDLSIVFRGTLNYVPVSHRRLLFYGVHGETSIDMKVGGRLLSPYLAAAYGPRNGSYGTLGLRITTALKQKR